MGISRLSLVTSILLLGVPCLGQATQITPNPNPSGSTIDIINDPFAFNNLNPYVNNGIINIGSTSALTNSGSITNTNGGILNNVGTLTNQAGSSITTLGLSRLSNAGTVTNYGSLTGNGPINTGTLINFGSIGGGGGTNSGTLINNGFISDKNGMSSSGLLTNNGTLITYTFLGNSGIMTNSGTVNVDGATLNNSGTLTNIGTMTVYGLSNSGTLVNSIGGTLDNRGPSPGGLGNTGTLINQGILIHESSSRPLNNGGTLINSGSIGNSGLGSGSFQNSGTVVNTGSIEQAMYTQTAGQTVNNGILTASVDVQGGSLSGTGIINGQVSLGTGATLSPGTATTFGTLTINGNLEGSGDLLFHIGGTGVGQFDVLAIHGMAFLNGGTIGVNFVNYTPVAGNSWNFIYANAISGLETIRFNLLGLSSDLEYAFTYSNGVETLRVYSVPEPNSFLLLILAFAGLTIWHRLQKRA